MTTAIGKIDWVKIKPIFLGEVINQPELIKMLFYLQLTRRLKDLALPQNQMFGQTKKPLIQTIIL